MAGSHSTGCSSSDTNNDASQTDSTRDTESEPGPAFDVVLMDMAMPVMDGLQVPPSPPPPHCELATCRSPASRHQCGNWPLRF